MNVRALLLGTLLLGLALAQQAPPAAPAALPGAAGAATSDAPAPNGSAAAANASDSSGNAADDADTAGNEVPAGSEDETPTPDQPDDGPGAAEEGANVTLTRKAKDGKERIIKIVRTGLTDDTGIFASCTPQDSDPAGSPTLSVFSETGAGGIQVTVDKNLIRAPLAIVTQQESGDGHIEMSAGTARFLDDPPEGKTDRLSRCAVEAKPQPLPDTVFVKQGRTDLKGKTLTYDESDGVARIDGPITFERSAEAGKPATDQLTGTSERIEVNVDKETTTLVGQVVLKNGARTSTAARVDYDDTANVAVLRGEAGKPAESVDGKDVIRAPVLRYNLDLNTVIALRSEDTPITGEFDDGDPAAPTTSAAPAAPSTP